MLFKKFEKNSDQIYLIICITLCILLIAVVVNYLWKNNMNSASENNNVSTTSVAINSAINTNASTTKTILNTVPTKKCNLKIISPTLYSKVTMPLMVTGILNTTDIKEGCLWNNADSLAGYAELFYKKTGDTAWKSAGVPVPMLINSYPGLATTSLKVSVSLNLYVKPLGLISGTPLRIIFTELNILDKPNPNTFDYFIYLK